MAAKTEAVLADASERFYEGVIHTAHGYWLAEAGARRAARPPLAGDVARRRRRHRRRLHRAVDGVAAARARARRWSCSRPSCAGTGRAGATAASARRCGRTCRRWSSASARERALEVCRASAESVAAIGAWCEEQGVDAWFTRAGYVMASTAPAHDARAATRSSPCAPPRARARARRRPRCAPAATRRASAAALFVPRRRDRAARPARARPARAAARARRAVFEHSRVRALHAGADGVVAETAGGRVRAGAAVLAVNAATRGFAAAARPPVGHLLAHRADRAGPRRAGGDRLDRRRVRHRRRARSCTTSAPRRDGRIAFGWGGGRLAPGRAGSAASVEVDADVAAETARAPRRDVPGAARAARSRTPGAARSTSRPSHLPQIGTLDGAPCTTRSASPATASARRTSPAARSPPLATGDRPTARAGRPRARAVPPEPFAWAGGMLVRRAFLRKERLEEEGRAVDPLTRAVTAAPTRARDPRGALSVYGWCMSRSRTNIELDDAHVQTIMDRYGVQTKTAAVDLALRHLAGQPMTRAEALAMRGARAIDEIPADMPPRQWRDPRRHVRVGRIRPRH